MTRPGNLVAEAPPGLLFEVEEMLERLRVICATGDATDLISPEAVGDLLKRFSEWHRNWPEEGSA